MFASNDSKVFSSCVLFHQSSIHEQFGTILRNAFTAADGEVKFLEELADTFSKGGAISLPPHSGLQVDTWAKMIHQRPYVDVGGVRVSELGDLLISVRYELGGGRTEEKSIIYQVKLETSQNNGVWSISHNQLNLLTDWPTFNLSGAATSHSIEPLTKEASSYLFLRKPVPAKANPISTHATSSLIHALGQADHNFGWTIPAIDLATIVDGVQDEGVSKFNGSRPNGSSSASEQAVADHAGYDWRTFTEHVAFLRGESHDFNAPFADLIKEVFAFVGSTPNQRDYSHGYFCAITITVKRRQ